MGDYESQSVMGQDWLEEIRREPDLQVILGENAAKLLRIAV